VDPLARQAQAVAQSSRLLLFFLPQFPSAWQQALEASRRAGTSTSSGGSPGTSNRRSIMKAQSGTRAQVCFKAGWQQPDQAGSWKQPPLHLLAGREVQPCWRRTFRASRGMGHQGDCIHRGDPADRPLAVSQQSGLHVPGSVMKTWWGTTPGSG